jgi:hypothetical protein
VYVPPLKARRALPFPLQYNQAKLNLRKEGRKEEGARRERGKRAEREHRVDCKKGHFWGIVAKRYDFLVFPWNCLVVPNFEADNNKKGLFCYNRGL